MTNEDDNYNLVWADEFNESELDKKNWGYELGHIRGLEQQHYTNSKDNVYLEVKQQIEKQKINMK